MMKRHFVTWALISMFVSAPAWAIPTLDQYQEQEGGAISAKSTTSQTWIGQTFTAGLSGVLDRVDIGNTFGMALLPAVAPIVQIRNIEGDQPGSTVLGSVTGQGYVPTNGWAIFDFASENILVTAGEMYAIVIKPSTSSGNVSMGLNPDPASYTNGAVWEYYSNSWQPYHNDGDIQFHTYVETGTAPTVPVPGAFLLASLGTGCMAWLRRARRM